MKPPQSPLAQSYTTVLDGSGNGKVSFGPNRARQIWRPPLTVAVSTSSVTNMPTAQLFWGALPQGGTYTGSQDSDDLPAVTLYQGDMLKVVWTGGDAGAVATATVTGTVDWW